MAQGSRVRIKVSHILCDHGLTVQIPCNFWPAPSLMMNIKKASSRYPILRRWWQTIAWRKSTITIPTRLQRGTKSPRICLMKAMISTPDLIRPYSLRLYMKRRNKLLKTRRKSIDLCISITCRMTNALVDLVAIYSDPIDTLVYKKMYKYIRILTATI